MSNKAAYEIKRLRIKAGETQAQLGAAIGVTGMAISKYESGESVPNDDNKVKIARHYGVPVQNIFYAEQ